MMFSRDLKRLNFEAVIPYDENDIMIIASPTLAFRLSNMVDDNGRYFCIKSIVTENSVFCCKDSDAFNKRCMGFAEIMEARIERFFITQKTSYLFFDDEEQKFLKDLIKRNCLTCNVIIYKRENQRERYNEIAYTDLPRREAMEVNKYMRRMRVMAVVRPDSFYSMYCASHKEAQERFSKMRESKDKDFMTNMLNKYSKLKNIETKAQLKLYQRGLLKKYHPDSNNGSHTLFETITSDFEALRGTYWYRMLKDNDDADKNDGAKKKQNFDMITASDERSRDYDIGHH